LRGGCQPADNYTFLYDNENANHQLGTGFIAHKRIISTATRVEFINDRMSYITLRGRWYDTIVLNVRTPTVVYLSVETN
jgi:hypothetical protein